MEIIYRDKEHKFNTTQAEKISRVREKKFPELQSFQSRNSRSSLNFLQNPPQNVPFSLNPSSSNGTWKILTRWNKVNSSIKMGKFCKSTCEFIHKTLSVWALRFLWPLLNQLFSKTKLFVSSLKITMYSEPRGLVILHWQLPQCQFISIILW